MRRFAARFLIRRRKRAVKVGVSIYLSPLYRVLLPLSAGCCSQALRFLRSARSLNLNQGLLSERVPAIEPRHFFAALRLLGVVRKVSSGSGAAARLDLLLARVLRDAQFVEIGLGTRLDSLRIQTERVRRRDERDLLAASENLVAATLLVPLGERRRHVHLLDNLTPSDARIVCAEGNFTLLRAVRDDAHLGAPKVVIEQVLKPHSRDKQEIPAVLAPLEDLPDAIGVALPQVDAAHDPASAPAELLIELLDQVDESKILWCLEWVVVANEREREADDRQDQAATGVIHLRYVLGEPLCPEE